jgi:hypothetical protein
MDKMNPAGVSNSYGRYQPRPLSADLNRDQSSQGVSDSSSVSQFGYTDDVNKLNKELGFVTQSLSQHTEALKRITSRLAEATEKPQEPDSGPVR